MGPSPLILSIYHTYIIYATLLEISVIYQEMDDGTEPTNTLYLSYIHHIYTTLLEISVIYQEIDDGTEPTNTLRLSYIHHIRYTVKNSSHIVPY